jgi:hypothetical protein
VFVSAAQWTTDCEEAQARAVRMVDRRIQGLTRKINELERLKVHGTFPLETVTYRKARE